MDFRAFAFSKNERVCRKKNVETLFKGKESRSLVAFPLRAVFVTEDTECKEDCPQAQVLVSVSKRRLRHAVDRNRAKRQIREAYRLHKQVLWDTACAQGTSLHIAFLWTANMPMDSDKVTRSVISLLETISTHLQNSRP